MKVYAVMCVYNINDTGAAQLAALYKNREDAELQRDYIYEKYIKDIEFSKPEYCFVLEIEVEERFDSNLFKEKITVFNEGGRGDPDYE